MTRWETAYTEYTLEGQPGDPGYMKLVTYERFFRPYTTNYGSGIFEDEDGHSYLFGGYSSGWGSYPVVARTETHDLKSTWSYYIKGDDNQWRWQEELPTATQLGKSYISDGWIGEPCLFKYLDKYYLVGQEPLGPQVWIWQGDHPWGPFKNSNRKMIYVTGSVIPSNRPNDWGTTYNTFLHAQLSKQGELVLSYNANPTEFGDNFNYANSADLYCPYFVRVFDWHKLWNLPDPNPTAIPSIQEKIHVNVYPNPVTDVLTIAAKPDLFYTWKLTSLTGFLLQSGKNAGNGKIDVNKYASGIYLLQVETEAGNYSLKVIKK
jgi:hypothetical protein